MAKNRLVVVLLVVSIASAVMGFSALAQTLDSVDSAEEPTVTVLAEGLFNPVGMAYLPNGGLLIAEEGTGNNDTSAGVSLMTPEGTVGRLISGIPSSRDSGDLSGVPFVSVSPDGETIYTGHFIGEHLYTLPVADALTLPDVPFTTDDMGAAMQPFNRVQLINPFDMTFDDDGVPVVSDASGNGVAKETEDGRTRFFHRFDPLIDPANDNLTLDPVPTGIESVGDEYYVTLFSGCPYPLNGGELVAIDENRNQRTVIDNLNMPIDVAAAADGTLWLLEFAKFSPEGSCFSGSGYRPNTGRLSRINDDGTLTPLIDNLNFPASVLPLDDGSVLVTELFDGQVLHIAPDGQTPPLETVEMSRVEGDATVRRDIAPVDYDAVLDEVIAQHNLTSNPGAALREGDTELAALGNLLFFDPILSGDKNIACSTCHHPAFGMADGRVLPIGSGGVGLGPDRTFADRITLSEEVAAFTGNAGRDYVSMGGSTIVNPFNGAFIPRNSPTILNSALLDVQFWDGRVSNYAAADGGVQTLENAINDMQLDDALVAQALLPITSLHEMAGATWGGVAPQRIRRGIVERLNNNPEYAVQFEAVFGTDEITIMQVVQALAAFERQLIFTDAPWDAYLAGDINALSEQEKRGALLFYGQVDPAVNCASCHSGDLFTDQDFHNLLVPQLGPGKGHGETGRDDWGRSAVSFDRRDQYAFRTPGLRNASLTAPYFHTGAYPTLHDAIAYHADIYGNASTYDPATYLPPSFLSSLQPFDASERLHSAAPQLVNGLPLTEQDIDDLTVFIAALTDPQATELDVFTPESLPSGLSLDELPASTPEPDTERAISPAAALALAGRASLERDTEIAAPDENWRFVDVTDAAGIAFEHGAFVTAIYDDPIAMMGAGLCWIDYDNDGWLDLYLVNSHAEDERDYWQGELPRNALYRNSGGSFTDVSAETGTGLALRGNGCIAADLNADGYMDIFVTADGANKLLWNNGNGTFTEGAADAGLDAPEWSTAAAAADLNRDGFLDLYVGGYIDLNNKVPKPVGAFPQDYYGIPDRLYISDGLQPNGRVVYREVSREVGLFRDERALGAIFTDADNDGDVDLYIANDGQANRLYEYVLADDAIGFRFLDVHETANVGDTGSGMGVASADYDGDGQFDLFVTNWEAELNALYRNRTSENGFINFEYSTYRMGMMGPGNNMTGWGAALADFDHDGDVDMLTVNGRVPITNLTSDPELIRLYGNRTVEGYTGQFREWTQQVGFDEVGELLARGSALADYDRDGDLDLVVNNIAGRAVLLENKAPPGNWLQVSFQMPQAGTVVMLQLPDGQVLRRELHIGSSYLASETPVLHFGLGQTGRIDGMAIHYPDGETHMVTDVPVNEMIDVR
ncbi:MAG: ScyD/ScyE family protein [Chloroflexota bacterium]